MSRMHHLKVGGLVVVGALVRSTGLAAAGVLPDAAQDAVSNVFDRVGITIPASGDHPATTGDEISQIATTTDATGVDKGAEISSAASAGKSQAGQHGSAQRSPPWKARTQRRCPFPTREAPVPPIRRVVVSARWAQAPPTRKARATAARDRGTPPRRRRSRTRRPIRPWTFREEPPACPPLHVRTGPWLH